MKVSALILVVTALLTQGCMSPPLPTDYRAYLDRMPVSILVLPPRNESTEVMAPYIYLSTVTRPLAERGYYVFPVAVIDALMKANGLPHPEDMATAPLTKIKEVIDPDAVLYMTVKDWGTKYRLIDSLTTVHLAGQLVDAETGAILWQGEHVVARSSSEGQSNAIGMLVAALVYQIASNFTDLTRDVARTNNAYLFWNQRDGLLFGRRHPNFEENQRQVRERMNVFLSEETGP